MSKHKYTTMIGEHYVRKACCLKRTCCLGKWERVGLCQMIARTNTLILDHLRVHKQFS